MYDTLQSAQLDKGKYVICINQMKYQTLNFYYNVAYSTSCQMYQSGYAYHRDSVNREEKPSANCRSYQQYNRPGGVHSEDFIHCDGTQLRLTDYNIGSEQYNSYAYYWWPAGRDGKLLFIFPTRVSLTTITLHYYSDSDRGLPKLRFYAVPDDFYVWNAPTTSLPHVDDAAVPPGAEPAGCRNVSINVNFNTSKVLMYKHRSSFLFAVSEVEYFTCISKYYYIPPFYKYVYVLRLAINTGGTRVSQQRSDNVNNRTVLQTKVEDTQSLQGYQGLVRAISNYHKSRRVTPPLRVGF